MDIRCTFAYVYIRLILTIHTRERVEPPRRDRAPLSRERVLRAAVVLADEDGIESLTMRHSG